LVSGRIYNFAALRVRRGFCFFFPRDCVVAARMLFAVDTTKAKSIR
jgi:hypothetical protein